MKKTPDVVQIDVKDASHEIYKKMNGGQKVTPVPYWQDVCPECGTKCVSACRCMANHRTCQNGHTWSRNQSGKAIMGGH